VIEILTSLLIDASWLTGLKTRHYNLSDARLPSGLIRL